MEQYIKSILNLSDKQFSRDCYFYYVVPESMQPEIANYFNNDTWKHYTTLVSFADRATHRKTACNPPKDEDDDSSLDDQYLCDTDDSENCEGCVKCEKCEKCEDCEDSELEVPEPAVTGANCSMSLSMLFPGLDNDKFRMCLALLLIVALYLLGTPNTGTGKLTDSLVLP